MPNQYTATLPKYVERTCQTCGAAFKAQRYDVARGYGRFCSRLCARKDQFKDAHPGSRGGIIDCTCAQCGAAFHALRHAVAKSGRRYCSRRCAYDAHKGAGNPIAVPRIERTCPVCGTTFLSTQDRINKGAAVHCSVACSAMSKRKRPEDRKAVERVCEECGKSFRADPAQVKLGYARYCGRACYGLAKRKNVGSLAPGWKGGSTPERVLARGRVQYREWQKAVYARDDYTCQDCGKRGGEIHAHHLLSYAEHPDVRYDVSNAVTLCPPCHHKRHRK